MTRPWARGTAIEDEPGVDAQKCRPCVCPRQPGGATVTHERVDGRLRIINDPPVVVPARELDFAQLGLDLDTWMEGLLGRYVRTLQPDRRHLVEQYRVVDAVSSRGSN